MSPSRLFNLDLFFIHNFSTPFIVNANSGAPIPAGVGAATIEVITGGKEKEDALSGGDEHSARRQMNCRRRRHCTLTPLPPADKHTSVDCVGDSSLCCCCRYCSIFLIMWQLPPTLRRVHLLGGVDGSLLQRDLLTWILRQGMHADLQLQQRGRLPPCDRRLRVRTGIHRECAIVLFF